MSDVQRPTILAHKAEHGFSHLPATVQRRLHAIQAQRLAACDQHRQRIDERSRVLRLQRTLVPMAPDGQCGYRAVLSGVAQQRHQVEGLCSVANDLDVEGLRNRVADFQGDAFFSHVASSLSELAALHDTHLRSWEDYRRGVRAGGLWMDNPCPRATAILLGRNILVIGDDAPMIYSRFHKRVGFFRGRHEESEHACVGSMGLPCPDLCVEAFLPQTVVLKYKSRYHFDLAALQASCPKAALQAS